MTVSLSYRDNALRVLDALKHLLKRYGIVLAILVGLIVAFSSRFTIGVNWNFLNTLTTFLKHSDS